MRLTTRLLGLVVLGVSLVACASPADRARQTAEIDALFSKTVDRFLPGVEYTYYAGAGGCEPLGGNTRVIVVDIPWDGSDEEMAAVIAEIADYWETEYGFEIEVAEGWPGFHALAEGIGDLGVYPQGLVELGTRSLGMNGETGACAEGAEPNVPKETRRAAG